MGVSIKNWPGILYALQSMPLAKILSLAATCHSTVLLTKLQNLDP